MKTHAVLALACALSCACGGRTAWDTATVGGGGPVLLPDGGAAAALFVGTWTCADAKTITFMDSTAMHISQTDFVTIVENADGTLTLTGRTAGGTPADGGADCSAYTFVVSDSTTAIAPGEATCTEDDGRAIYTLRNGTFVVSGDSAQIDIHTSSAGPDVDPSNNSVIGTCTRDDAGAP